MAMTAAEIASHPALERCVRDQAETLLSMQQTSPRIASVFATQQRWLMAHAALAKFFRNEAAQPGRGLLAEHFLDDVVRHDIASRNSASAFLKEMLKYEIVAFVASGAGRGRPLAPAPAVLMALFQWHSLHLSTLDGLDGGARVARFHAQPSLLSSVQPLIADGLIGSAEVRAPERTFSLFTWINEGGIVMDRLMAGCGEVSRDGARVLTDVTSISALAGRLRLSRTQLSRKFSQAETMGSLGWSGMRRRSALWLSADFRREYHVAQAVKLAIIDTAFEACG
jgi:AraC-like DNA-binding protein